jgi:hypothetical protein
MVGGVEGIKGEPETDQFGVLIDSDPQRLTEERVSLRS